MLQEKGSLTRARDDGVQLIKGRSVHGWVRKLKINNNLTIWPGHVSAWPRLQQGVCGRLRHEEDIFFSCISSNQIRYISICILESWYIRKDQPSYKHKE